MACFKPLWHTLWPFVSRGYAEELEEIIVELKELLAQATKNDWRGPDGKFISPQGGTFTDNA